MIEQTSQNRRFSYQNWAFFSILPLATIILPALLGHPPILGDNATQNVSLRWLVGQDFRSGHLPTWDPFNWDGTPLLAGFNAGAFYPLIVLFVLLPANAAMTVALAACWLAAEVVIATIAQTIGISRWFAIAAGMVFVGTGAFTAQVVHIDMIEGDVASLFALLFLLRVLDSPTRSDRIRNATWMAVAFGCAIFAGAPEAMLAGLVTLGTLFLVRLLTRRIDIRSVILVALGAALALGLAAPQWFPGLAYTALSNRAHLPAHYAGVGPFGYRFLPLILYPFAYGGYSGGYLPNYFGNYNPSEITIAITIVGLIFVIVGLGTRRIPTLVPWAKTFLVALMIVAGLLALGSQTPIAVLVYHLPLFDLQRLASRYIIDVDLAGVLLSAAGADYYWNGGQLRSLNRTTIALLRALGILVIVVGFFLVAFPTQFYHLVDTASIPTGNKLLEVRIYVLIEGLLGLLGLRAVLRTNARKQAPKIDAPSHYVKSLKTTLLSVVVLEVLGMAIQFVVLPAFYEPLGNPAAPAANAIVHGSERYGLYDPQLYLYDRAIAADEQLDRNVFTGTNSIQGYASLSLASYNNLTDTKVQSTLNPSLIPFYHRRLNMDLLITSRRYFRLPVPNIKLTTLATQASRPQLSPRSPTSFFVGNIRKATALLIHPGTSFTSVKVNGQTTNGMTFHVGDVPLSSTGWARITLPSAIKSQLLSFVTITGQSKRSTRQHSSPRRIDLVVVAGSQDLEVAGPLVNHVSPSAWRSLEGKYSSLDFVSVHPRSGYLQPNRNVTILSQSQATDGTVRAQMRVRAPTTVSTTLAYAPGWYAKSAAGTPLALHNADGLLSISMKPGRASIVLAYRAPRLTVSLVLGAVSLAIIILLFGLTWYDRKRSI